MSGENIKMVLEIINTLAILIASVVAVCGISAWRKEFQGKRNIEIAEEVLVLFYEAKDAIRAIRAFLRQQGEGATITPPQAYDSVVVYERYEKRHEIFNKLTSKRYQFKARFGDEKDKPFEDLKNIINEILNAAYGLSMTLSTPYNNNDPIIKKQIKEFKSIMICTDQNDPKDPINPRLDKVISDIEGICKPIILGKK